jgi:hypothetical protein
LGGRGRFGLTLTPTLTLTLTLYLRSDLCLELRLESESPNRPLNEQREDLPAAHAGGDEERKELFTFGGLSPGAREGHEQQLTHALRVVELGSERVGRCTSPLAVPGERGEKLAAKVCACL